MVRRSSISFMFYKALFSQRLAISGAALLLETGAKEASWKLKVRGILVRSYGFQTNRG